MSKSDTSPANRRGATPASTARQFEFSQQRIQKRDKALNRGIATRLRQVERTEGRRLAAAQLGHHRLQFVAGNVRTHRQVDETANAQASKQIGTPPPKNETVPSHPSLLAAEFYSAHIGARNLDPQRPKPLSQRVGKGAIDCEGCRISV